VALETEQSGCRRFGSGRSRGLASPLLARGPAGTTATATTGATFAPLTVGAAITGSGHGSVAVVGALPFLTLTVVGRSSVPGVAVGGLTVVASLGRDQGAIGSTRSLLP
jgi:hypothetical protein